MDAVATLPYGVQATTRLSRTVMGPTVANSGISYPWFWRPFALSEGKSVSFLRDLSFPVGLFEITSGLWRDSNPRPSLYKSVALAKLSYKGMC